MKTKDTAKNLTDLRAGVEADAMFYGRAATIFDIVAVVESLGGEVVEEKTISFKDDQGGWEWDVLDYEPNKKNARKRYLVLELPEEFDRVVPW